MGDHGLWEKTLEVLKKIGARPSASAKEKELLSFVRDTLQNLGMMVEWDDFPAPSTYTWGHLLLWVGLAQAGLLVVVVPLWSVLSSLFFLLAEYLELATFPVLSSLFCFHRSANVIGKYSHIPEFVLMAHVDSARPSIFFHPRFATNPRFSLLLLVYSSLFITGSSIFAMFWSREVLFWVAFFPSLYLIFLALGHLHREFWMVPSPGGNDNGSGVAVVLELAKRLKERGVPFWVVFTGAEESGTWGALHLLQKYGPLLKGKPVLNIDSVGIGALTVATREGMWKLYQATPGLVAGFQSLQESVLHFRPYLGLSTDATPLLARGFEALTIIALGENGLPVHWHWGTDTVGALERNNLVQVVQIVTRWVEERYGHAS
ncbi:MAG: M28 family peptidase [Atribacterota bacterium]